MMKLGDKSIKPGIIKRLKDVKGYINMRMNETRTKTTAQN